MTFKKKLSYGSKSNEVKMVQEKRLALLGFFDKKATSGFYTHAGGGEFQTYNGLVSDGVVGEETQDVMFSLDVVRADATAQAHPEPTPIPYFVEVDVNNQSRSIKTTAWGATPTWTRSSPAPPAPRSSPAM